MYRFLFKTLNKLFSEGSSCNKEGGWGGGWIYKPWCVKKWWWNPQVRLSKWPDFFCLPMPCTNKDRGPSVDTSCPFLDGRFRGLRGLCSESNRIGRSFNQEVKDWGGDRAFLVLTFRVCGLFLLCASPNVCVWVWEREKERVRNIE